MTYSLKRLVRDEMDAAAIVHRTAFDERLPWLVGLHAPADDRRFFRNRMFVECEVWGAIDAEMIGFIAFRQGWIDQLYVLPSRQAQGVGTALLGVAQTTWTSLRLWTFQRNVLARRLYERHGFVAIEETDGSGNAEREPDVLYEWRRSLQGPA